jgi:hypothetical protein
MLVRLAERAFATGVDLERFSSDHDDFWDVERSITKYYIGANGIKKFNNSLCGSENDAWC